MYILRIGGLFCSAESPSAFSPWVLAHALIAVQVMVSITQKACALGVGPYVYVHKPENTLWAWPFMLWIVTEPTTQY